jgi:hypothetical protein
MKQPPSTSVLRNLDLLSTVAEKKKSRSAWRQLQKKEGNHAPHGGIPAGGSRSRLVGREKNGGGNERGRSHPTKKTERARLVGSGME